MKPSKFYHMKKLYSLLLLLCFVMGGSRTSAQITAVSELSNTAKYVITWNRTNYGGLNTFKANTETTVSNTRKLSETYNPETMNSQEAYQFAIIKKDGEEKYYLYSVGQHKWVKPQVSNNNLVLSSTVDLTTDYVTFDPHTTSIGSSGDPCGFSENIFHIVFSGNGNLRINVNGAGNFVLHTAAGASDDPGNVFQITNVGELTAEDAAAAYNAINARVDVSYTLHCEALGETYEGTYQTVWQSDNTETPTFSGANGCTFTNTSFVQDGGIYKLTGNIVFPFPVSSATTKHSTGIKSALGNGYYFHVGSGVNEGKLWCTKNTNADMGTLTLETINSYRWYIYPHFSENNFSFTIQNAGTGNYIPTSTTNGTTGPSLVEEASAGTFYFVPSQGSQNGFCTGLSVNEGGLFLSVNSSSSANQGVFFYNMSNPSHVGSNLSFPEPPIANELVNAVFDPMQNATIIPVTEGATVISPKEIAAPADINAAIAAAQALGATATESDNKNLPKIDFTESAQGGVLSTYNTQVAAHGALLSADYTLKAQYGTICLPFNYADPTNWNFYRCSASNGDLLTLEQETYTTRLNGNRWGANTPYIVEYTGDDMPTAETPKQYQFIGYGRNAGSGVQADGWLRGALDEGGATVNAGEYILARRNNKIGFYPIAEGNTYTCAQYKCFLVVPSAEAASMALYFESEGEITGVDNLTGDAERTEIYSIAGQRLNRLQKGINIVNGQKVIVR